jgi:taurine dioxygenase
LIFHKQSITPNKLENISKRFGEFVKYPFSDGLPEAHNVLCIKNAPTQHEKFSSVWHSDSSFLSVPPDMSFLYAVEMPSTGGDTVFANSLVAFKSLSPSIQLLCNELTVTNVSNLNPALQRKDFLETPGNHAFYDYSQNVFSAVHPLARKHPEIGRYGIFANMEHTRTINELNYREEDFILALLYQHLSQHEHTCRIRWKPGTLAIWDNRSTQHRALNDYHGEKRIMWRTLIKASNNVC